MVTLYVLYHQPFKDKYSLSFVELLMENNLMDTCLKI